MYRKIEVSETVLPDGRIIPARTEFQTSAKLLEVGRWNEELVLKNDNKTKFIINNIEIELPNGKTVDRSAMCFEGNYNPQARKDGSTQPLEVGKSYLTILRFDEQNKPQLQMSHLTNANRATSNDFAELYAEMGLAIPASNIKVEEVQARSETTTAGKGAPVESEA
jgi:hypothetical protein